MMQARRRTTGVAISIPKEDYVDQGGNKGIPWKFVMVSIVLFAFLVYKVAFVAVPATAVLTPVEEGHGVLNAKETQLPDKTPPIIPEIMERIQKKKMPSPERPQTGMCPADLEDQWLAMNKSVDDRTIVFVHCPKNGGSAMNNALSSALKMQSAERNGQAYPKYCSAHAPKCGSCASHPHPGYPDYQICLFKNQTVPTFEFPWAPKTRNREGYKKKRPTTFLESEQSAWFFYLLRDGVARAVSEYVMCAHRGRCWDYDTGRELSIDEYASLDRSFFCHSRQTRMLAHEVIDPMAWSTSEKLRQDALEAAKNNLCTMPFFGLHSRFNETMIMLSYYLGQDVHLPDKGRFQQHPELSAEVREKLEEKNREDVELFSFAEQLFEERWVRFQQEHPDFHPDVSPQDSRKSSRMQRQGRQP